ncbi:MAG: chemotaxis protein CheW [Bryobacterales bacterium]|nr:chemotaxis protein CheW [Bryobacterales bacterium]
MRTELAGPQEKMPWLIAQLGQQLYGVRCGVVREMVIMPEVCAVPGVPGYVRGVMNLRGRVTPLVDLRVRLGMRSSVGDLEAMCDLMQQRAQDHRRWLEELEACVKENRRFGLARDPHQCAFGKWYDQFRTDNIVVAALLKRFDAPHQRVHALAAEVDDLVGQGCARQALNLLNSARSTVLSRMLGLFSELQETLRECHREIAILIDGECGSFAVSVDAPVAVETLMEVDAAVVEGTVPSVGDRLITSVAKRSKTQELVFLLSEKFILDPAVRSSAALSP